MTVADGPDPRPDETPRRSGRRGARSAVPALAPAPERQVPVGLGRDRRLSVRGLLAIIGGVIAAVLILTLLLGIFVLSSANVTLALESGRVTGTVDCEIVPPGGTGTAPVVVEGEQTDLDATWTGSVPTTGSRAVPDAAASGRVRFSNPTDQTVTIRAGTELGAPGGQAYTVTSDVTVAAGNAALSQFGSGEAVVQASAGGAAGNIGAGELSGQLDNGVYYSNRDAAMTGGTDREIRTVQPADLQTLHDAATEQLRQLVATGQAGNLDSDTQVVPATVTLATPDFQDDHQAGDDGDAVSTTATATATVLTYSNQQLRSQATAALIPVLSEQLSPGLQLSESTVQLNAQGGTGEQSDQGATFQVVGTADTTASLSDAEANAIADELAGKSASDVNSILSNNRAHLLLRRDATRPAGCPTGCRRSADRIDITVRQ